ncbi:MAG: SIR2 family protein, partial [Chloroflexota bacterium]
MTASNPAPLLPARTIEQVKRIAQAIRHQEAAPLVGAGTSVRSGLPTWNDLIQRIILAWKAWDRSPARLLSPQNYVSLMRQTFEDNNLAIISHLRNRINATSGDTELSRFGQLLYSALYSRLPGPGRLFTPEPDHAHRHLVALFSQYPHRMWTMNYDDLLEEAARLNGIAVRTLDPDHRLASGDLLVEHIHGFLAPPGRLAGQPDPGEAPVVLAEDDYHAVSADVVGWTNREVYRLFDEHRVLILGMSLSDPNLRRVLATLPESSASSVSSHFAVMRAIREDELDLPRTRDSGRATYATCANEIRSWYWQKRGVEIIELPDHDSLLPLLVRLRYESFGNCPGDLWKRAGALGYSAIDPWRPDRQVTARHYLTAAVDALVKE